MSSPIKTVTNPRDVAPPPAPKKVKPLQPSPSDITAHPFFLHGPAPGAPTKEPHKVKLSVQTPEVVKMATKHMAAAFYPLWCEYYEDDEDGAHYLALSGAAEVTPLGLPEGPFKEMVAEAIGYKTFTFDLDELWIDHNCKNGVVTTLTVNVNMQKFTYPIDALAAKDVSAEHGHWEFQKIGKGGREWFWVEAKAIN